MLRLRAGLVALAVTSAVGTACVRSGWQEWTFAVPGDAAPAIDAGGELLGDFDGDGCVDCADVAAFEAALGEPDPDPAFDLNGDGEVDLSDISFISENLGRGCSGPLMLSLVVQGEGFDAYQGARVRGALSITATGEEVGRRDAIVDQGMFHYLHDALLEHGVRYRIDLFLDADQNQRCGADDLVWRREITAQLCLEQVDLSPLTPSLLEACTSFAITGDLDGDGCVGDRDYAIFYDSFSSPTPDLVADLNGDGMVTTVDFGELLRNWGLGCADRDGGPTDVPTLPGADAG